MWRYREHMDAKSAEFCGEVIPTSAYIWKSEEDQSQDSICMYRSNYVDSHMTVVYFTYDFNSVDLAKESFIDSVKKCIHRTVFSLHGYNEDLFRLFRHLKNKCFTAVEQFPLLVEDMNNADRSHESIVIDSCTESNDAFIMLSSDTHQDIIKLIKLDAYADMSCYSDAKERFSLVRDTILLKLYGYFGADLDSYRLYVYNAWAYLLRKYFPLTPINIAEFKRDLILSYYYYAAEWVDHAFADYKQQFEYEADERDLKIAAKLHPSDYNFEDTVNLEKSVKNTIQMLDLAKFHGCSDVEVGTF